VAVLPLPPAEFRQDFTDDEWREVEALLGDDCGEGAAQVGLGGVGDGGFGVAGAEGLEEGATLAAQGVFVKDVEGSAEVSREIDEVAAADSEMTVSGDFGRCGEDFGEGYGGLLHGG